jgi:predicted lipoprotein with Yx(FWY)xxD motif
VLLNTTVKRGSSWRPVRQLGVAGLTLASALAIAGCGSSSSHSSSRSAGFASRTSSTATKTESTSTNMTHSGSMMGGARHPAAAAHAALTLGFSEYGRAIYDAQHRALYLFSADHTSASTCYGACAAAWPPMLTKGAPSIAAGLKAGLLGTTRRNDGSLQVTYAGHPLYYYSGDTGAKIMCQHVKLHGGFWYVVKPNGVANLAKGHGMM